MLPFPALRGLCLVAFALSFTIPAPADTYHVIVSGKVTMEDGSVPPFTVGIERVCSDLQGSGPGPITNKKGEFIWNMELDAFRSRACWIRATHEGYISTSLDISGINATSHDTTHTLPPLVLSKKVPDPYSIITKSEDIPFRARGPFDAAMKALDTPNYAEAATQLEAAVKASAKFTEAWHALGVIDERLNKPAEARDAYEHAIKADPKFVRPYITLARLCLKTKDWDCASKTAAQGLKADPKHVYPELYIHQAVAQYELKDLSGAQSSVEEAIKLDPLHHLPREEYVLGRILEAKGDANGAKEHMANYLKLDPAPPDVDLVKGHLDNLGKPEAAAVDPPLEIL
jgi:Tfp pilus assembly protein PilF